MVYNMYIFATSYNINKNFYPVNLRCVWDFIGPYLSTFLSRGQIVTPRPFWESKLNKGCAHFCGSSCSTISGDGDGSVEVHHLAQVLVIARLPLVGVHQFPLKAFYIYTYTRTRVMTLLQGNVTRATQLDGSKNFRVILGFLGKYRLVVSNNTDRYLQYRLSHFTTFFHLLCPHPSGMPPHMSLIMTVYYCQGPVKCVISAYSLSVEEKSFAVPLRLRAHTIAQCCLISFTGRMKSRRFRALSSSCVTTMSYCLWLCKTSGKLIIMCFGAWLQTDSCFRRGTFSFTDTEIPSFRIRLKVVVLHFTFTFPGGEYAAYGWTTSGWFWSSV